uniref:Uncharacterized protein n=1 Tax=Nothobranchius furzeri TaxID=105023 RepID=A0A1A8ABL7_NOTFU
MFHSHLRWCCLMFRFRESVFVCIPPPNRVYTTCCHIKKLEHNGECVACREDWRGSEVEWIRAGCKDSGHIWKYPAVWESKPSQDVAIRAAQSGEVRSRMCCIAGEIVEL